jgi:hypothetical protein
MCTAKSTKVPGPRAFQRNPRSDEHSGKPSSRPTVLPSGSFPHCSCSASSPGALIISVRASFVRAWRRPQTLTIEAWSPQTLTIAGRELPTLYNYGVSPRVLHTIDHTWLKPHNCIGGEALRFLSYWSTGYFSRAHVIILSDHELRSVLRQFSWTRSIGSTMGLREIDPFPMWPPGTLFQGPPSSCSESQ